MRSIIKMLICLCFTLAATPMGASDHADPAWLSNGRQEANLTGLFFYPKDDRYIIILDTRPTLTAAPPYNLAPYVFTVNIDTHSQIRFKSSEDFQCNVMPPSRGNADVQLQNGNYCRYGGTVVEPTGIRPDISFVMALDNSARFFPDAMQTGKLKIVGAGFDHTLPVQIFDDNTLGRQARDPNAVWVYAGVRDDPFIFPKFFNANIITMVISLPKTAILSRHPDWLLWANSKYAGNGEQIDHVGRSNRTQLGRFDILNTKEPSQHLRALHEAQRGREQVQDFFKEVARPLGNLNQLSGFVLRSYDFAPDVMIFTTRYPPGFPNGRRLEDDVAETTCQWGDCPLHENSYIDSSTFQRAIVNDKPFLEDFPYLAEHWPWRPQPFVGSPWHWFRTHLLWPIVVLLVGLYLLRRAWRLACVRLRAKRSD